MRKLSILLGILLLATVSTSLSAKERQGADIVIVTKNASTVRGELIAVKDHSIVVLDHATKGDVSVDVPDMVSLSVKVARKGSALPMATLGFLALGGLGAVVGHELGKSDGSLVDFETGFTIGGAAIGGIIGGGGGYLLSKKKRQEVYHFQGKSPEEVLTILARLRTYARVPGYR